MLSRSRIPRTSELTVAVDLSCDWASSITRVAIVIAIQRCWTGYYIGISHLTSHSWLTIMWMNVRHHYHFYGQPEQRRAPQDHSLGSRDGGETVKIDLYFRRARRGLG